LEYHNQISKEPFGVKVFPTWRPDKAMAIENQTSYNHYLNLLEKVSGCNIKSYQDLLTALKKRHDFFASMGCKLSDHGLETFYSDSYTSKETERIFLKVRGRKDVSYSDAQKLKSAILFDLAVMDWEKSWTQQFHIGAIRNNNPRLFSLLGPDVGCDAIHELPIAEAGHKFFGRLDKQGNLTKTILYNLNPKDNESIAALAYTFNDGSIVGKMQYGSAWWFLDNEYGIETQINTLSSQGLLSRFIGMTTDSRSFLSYPRHEYFRRILCNLIGNDLEKGKLPLSEMDFIGQMTENIAYYNAKKYIAL
jgi:glucuronate isomerase